MPVPQVTVDLGSVAELIEHDVVTRDQWAEVGLEVERVAAAFGRALPAIVVEQAPRHLDVGRGRGVGVEPDAAVVDHEVDVLVVRPVIHHHVGPGGGRAVGIRVHEL